MVFVLELPVPLPLLTTGLAAASFDPLLLLFDDLEGFLFNW
jgi:hypothetical protein